MTVTPVGQEDLSAVTDEDRKALAEILGQPEGWASPERDSHPEFARALLVLSRHRLSGQTAALVAVQQEGQVMEVTQADRDAYEDLMSDDLYDHLPHAAWYFARHRTTALAAKEAELADLRAREAKLREALAAEDAFRIAERNHRDAAPSQRWKTAEPLREAARRCDIARAALTQGD